MEVSEDGSEAVPVVSVKAVLLRGVPADDEIIVSRRWLQAYAEQSRDEGTCDNHEQMVQVLQQEMSGLREEVIASLNEQILGFSLQMCRLQSQLDICQKELHEIKEEPKVTCCTGRHVLNHEKEWTLYQLDKFSRERVNFQRPFEKAPQVTVALSGLDHNGPTLWTRVLCWAEEIDAQGFTIVFKTWCDSRSFITVAVG